MERDIETQPDSGKHPPSKGRETSPFTLTGWLSGREFVVESVNQHWRFLLPIRERAPGTRRPAIHPSHPEVPSGSRNCLLQPAKVHRYGSRKHGPTTTLAWLADRASIVHGPCKRGSRTMQAWWKRVNGFRGTKGWGLPYLSVCQYRISFLTGTGGARGNRFVSSEWSLRQCPSPGGGNAAASDFLLCRPVSSCCECSLCVGRWRSCFILISKKKHGLFCFRQNVPIFVR